MTTFGQRVREARVDAGLTQPQLAKLTKLSQTTISDIERGRNGGSGAVTVLARILNVEADWLAEGRGEKKLSELKTEQQRAEYVIAPSTTKLTGYDIQESGYKIPQYDTGGKMGDLGLVLNDQAGVITSWNVSDEWLQKNVRHCTGYKNLAIVTGFGDSMLGMFNSGDPLLVDAGVTTCDHDGVYFFRIGNHGYIKRLQRIPTANGLIIKAKSANKEYDTFDIEDGMDFHVLAKVLTVWKSERF